MIAKRVLLTGVLICALSPIAASQDHQQTYPHNLIRMTGPGGAAAPADALARILAQPLQAALGQNVIVENIPGAGGMIAARTVARAAPDGHTLFFGNTTTLAIIPA